MYGELFSKVKKLERKRGGLCIWLGLHWKSESDLGPSSHKSLLCHFRQIKSSNLSTWISCLSNWNVETNHLHVLITRLFRYLSRFFRYLYYSCNDSPKHFRFLAFLILLPVNPDKMPAEGFCLPDRFFCLLRLTVTHMDQSRNRRSIGKCEHLRIILP